MTKYNGPKILILDIETAPILANVWGLFDQTIGLNMIEKDWHILSWSAKWLHESKVMYQDQRGKKDIENDKDLMKGMWKLLDEADVIITQNGKRFDIPKLNARFVINGMQPPSTYQHIDVCRIAKSKFGFTSNKLEYLSKKLNVKYAKQDHKKFPGFELWKAVMKGNLAAWKEMEKYNKYDVLALEELYHKLSPWAPPYHHHIDDRPDICPCGSTRVHANGYLSTATGKFQRFRCNDCGRSSKGRKNLLVKGDRPTRIN